MTADRGSAASIEIRRVRADEWEQTRALRLDALHDPVAHLAFVETLAEAEERPDSFWQERAERAASGSAAAQFLAEGSDGALHGTVTVLVAEPGEEDVLGDTTDARRAVVVGVYVRPGVRGVGLVDQMLAAVAHWVQSLDVGELTLYVHPQNARALAAYVRCGFVETGAPRDLHGVPHLELRRPAQAGSTGRFS